MSAERSHRVQSGETELQLRLDEQTHDVPRNKVRGDNDRRNKVRRDNVRRNKVRGDNVPRNKVQGDNVPRSKVQGDNVLRNKVRGDDVAISGGEQNRNVHWNSRVESPRKITTSDKLYGAQQLQNVSCHHAQHTAISESTAYSAGTELEKITHPGQLQALTYPLTAVKVRGYNIIITSQHSLDPLPAKNNRAAN